MTKKSDEVDERRTRVSIARRSQVMRVDALVGNAQREIERVFELPRGSVQINLPNGKKARKDKLIGSLLHDWSRK